jgi:GNAT superfamily N-acetyltransferase
MHPSFEPPSLTAMPSFRQATAAEMGAAVEMRAHMLADLAGKSPDVPDRSWRDRFASFYSSRMAAERAAIFFAEYGGRVLGNAMAYLLVNHRSEIQLQQSAYISGVYVFPEWRRRGIASRLTLMTIGWAREHGCVYARLRTSEMGRFVYERLGFTQSDEMELRLVSSDV